MFGAHRAYSLSGGICLLQGGDNPDPRDNPDFCNRHAGPKRYSNCYKYCYAGTNPHTYPNSFTDTDNNRTTRSCIWLPGERANFRANFPDRGTLRVN